jgi:hypothetical protein
MMDGDADHAAATTRRRVAWLCAGLMFVVVVASAFLRHHADANAQLDRLAEIGWVRQLHRVAATLVLLGAVALVLLARRAREPVALRLSSSLLVTALLLSAVGVAAGASHAAPVVLVNLLGGFTMLALCARLTAPARSPTRPSLGRAAWWLLGLAALQAAGGAWASTSALPDCLGLSDCAWPPLLHRISGLLLGYVLLLFGVMAGGRGRLAGRALASVAVLLLVLGMLAAGLGSIAMPGLVVLHNAGAALAIGLLARLA